MPTAGKAGPVGSGSGWMHSREETPTFCETRTLPSGSAVDTDTQKYVDGNRRRAWKRGWGREQKGAGTVPPLETKMASSGLVAAGAASAHSNLWFVFGQNGKQGEQVHKSQLRPGSTRRQMCVVLTRFFFAIFRSLAGEMQSARERKIWMSRCIWSVTECLNSRGRGDAT